MLGDAEPTLTTWEQKDAVALILDLSRPQAKLIVKLIKII
jgi:hypothetical protein